MHHFPFINIENKSYPSVIMGEDRFTGWFGKKLFNTEKQREIAYKDSIETAYDCGVRGFSMSPHPTLIKVLKNFKKEHPEIVCISNHHWQTHYYLGKKSLWTKENMERLASTEKYYLNQKVIEKNILKLYASQTIIGKHITISEKNLYGLKKIWKGLPLLRNTI